MLSLRYQPVGETLRAFSSWGVGGNDPAFVRGLMGPIGGGKSTACLFEMLAIAVRQAPGPDGVRRTRWAVIRNTYPELKTTTIRSWHQWVPETVGRWQAEGPPTHNVTFDLNGKRIELEVIFLALDRPDDTRKLLSLELTGGWINEAREVGREVLDALTGRVGRFPSMAVGGPTWSGIIMDTNSPDTDHWWYQLFEEDRPAGYQLFRQPGGRSLKAENLANLPRDYYERAALGKKPEWITVYIDADYGMVQDGKPIYPEYVDREHCRAAEIVPGLAVHVGIDFGLTPAAVFGQRKLNGQWVWRSEVVATSMGAVRFAEEVKRELATRYAGHPVVVTGDPAGEQRAQTDERTPFQILRGRNIPARPARTNDATIRREAVAGALSRLVDGAPGLLIHPDCKVTRKGMAGGYRYRRIAVSGARYEDKPEKNAFSHPCEAGQYLMLGGGEGETVLGRARAGTGGDLDGRELDRQLGLMMVR